MDLLGLKINSNNKYTIYYKAFIGCFSTEKNNLTLFRSYGKENKEEGTGICITLNDDFFSTDGSSNIFPKVSMISEGNYLPKGNEYIKYPLFKCIYIAPKISLQDQKLIDPEIMDLLIGLKESIKEIENSFNSDKRVKIDDIICNLLLPIRLLVKHDGFKDEHECRIICVKDINQDKKKKEDDREIKYNDDCSRMYIEYNKITNDFLEEIIFGPKFKNHEIFANELKHNQVKCDFKKSDLPLS